jgi:hypothetical protein
VYLVERSSLLLAFSSSPYLISLPTCSETSGRRGKKGHASVADLSGFVLARKRGGVLHRGPSSPSQSAILSATFSGAISVK